MKFCPKCKTVKALKDFYVRKENGRPSSYCKDCVSSYYREWSEANSEKLKIAKKTWYQANPEKAVYASVKYKYGLSPEEYDAMPKVCAICGATESLQVDHNHATGEIRGILCRKCNVGLGYFDDDPTLLLRAVDYLTGMLTEKIQCMVNDMLGKR